MRLSDLKVRVTVRNSAGWPSTIAVGFTAGLIWGNRAFEMEIGLPVAILVGFAVFGIAYLLDYAATIVSNWIARALQRRAERRAA